MSLRDYFEQNMQVYKDVKFHGFLVIPKKGKLHNKIFFHILCGFDGYYNVLGIRRCQKQANMPLETTQIVGYYDNTQA